MVSRIALTVGTALALSLGAVTPALAASSDAPADYVAIVNHAEINRPAAQVWKRVGGYCAIAEWLGVTCTYQSGSGQLGSVRIINGNILEVMVAESPLSYTYWQTKGAMAPAGYHGTVAIVPHGKHRSTVVYTLVYNQDAFSSEAERTAQRERLAKRFEGACDAIKKLSEAQPAHRSDAKR